MFLSDYPRGFTNCFWFCGFPAADPLPVALALTAPLLLAGGCLPVALLRLPPRPRPRRLPTLRTAIALPRLPRLKTLLASLEQTAPRPRPADCLAPSPGRLFRGIACMIPSRAHGR